MHQTRVLLGLAAVLFASLAFASLAAAFVVPTSSPTTCPPIPSSRPRLAPLTMASTPTASGMSTTKPRALLPPIILSNVPGTWAYDTMSRRIRDDILVRIYAENDALLSTPAGASIKAQLDQLKRELETPHTSPLPPIQDDGGPDVGVWGEIMAPYMKSNWLEAPWLVTEFYFYRRIVQIFGYFQRSYDPFKDQKRLGLEGALELTQQLAARAEEVHKAGDPETALRFALFASLWGNKMDLSLWPSQSDAANKAQTFANVLEASSVNLLADDFPAVAAHLKEGGKERGRVDIIVDNAGFELITDLLLADALLVHGLASKVVFHTKGHPTFVSDAMDKDVKETIDYLATAGVVAAKDRWGSYLKTGQWELHAHNYWAQPFPFWERPGDVSEDLSKAKMAFVKGDANYRRLLGDREWDLSIGFDQVASYFPCPIVALRTLKAELGCGMMEGEVGRARKADAKDWMVTGKYGVVQFVDPAKL